MDEPTGWWGIAVAVIALVSGGLIAIGRERELVKRMDERHARMEQKLDRLIEDNAAMRGHGVEIDRMREHIGRLQTQVAGLASRVAGDSTGRFSRVREEEDDD